MNTLLFTAALLLPGQPSLQIQPGAVTLTDPVAPAAATLAEPGEIAGAHVAAACITVKVLAPMVSVPVRDVVSLFAATA